MTNKSFRKGYNFELRVKKYLEKKGYLVIRQGGSKFPDLIAIPGRDIKKSQVLAIECKTDIRNLRTEERFGLKALEDRFRLKAIVATKEKCRLVFLSPFNVYLERAI